MFRDMRRIKQLLPNEVAEKILREGDYGVLALSGDDGYAYAVPINYAVDGNKIYFHSAKVGHKIDAIARNEKVSFCVVDKHDVVAEEFTSYFSSAIAFGRIKVVEDRAEKIHGLELLADKFSSTASPERRERELSRVDALSVLVLEVEHLTGKAARELVKRDGTAEKPYEINSAEDLKQLAEDVNAGNDFAGKFFVLTADIELSGNRTPIGYFNSNDDKKPFNGTFDGQAHTIKNLTIDNPLSCRQGLFGWNEGTIKNLNLTNVNVSGCDSVGGLVGRNDGTVENCTLGDAKIGGNTYVGGFVGRNDGKVENCTLGGASISGNYDVGDLVGSNGGKVENCTVSGATVSGDNYVGGLVGSNGGTVENCTLGDTSISGNHDVGALVGSNGSTVKNCTVSGATISGNGNVGGLVGSNGSTVENCTLGDTSISAYANVGGLVGSNRGTVENCTVNNAKIGGYNCVGGLVGFNHAGTVENCTVSDATVSGTEKVGGLVGSNFVGTVENCTDSGTVVSCKF